MPAYRFPVCIWEDREGFFTGCLVEDSEITAVSDSVDGVLDQLAEFLRWEYAEDRRWFEPDIVEVGLLQVTVSVLPEYVVAERVYPCEEPVALRVACVHGEDPYGSRVAVIPALDIRFYYADDSKLSDLVIHYVRQALKQTTPRDLARCLPPKAVTLHQVVVQVQTGKEKRRPPAAYEALEQVAEPLAAASLRRAFAGVWCREAEITALTQRLRQEKTNIILLGERGVGKTAILVEATKRFERQLANAEERATERRRCWLTNASRLIAGMKYLGQWEARCVEVIGELARFGGILCVENLMDLLRAAGDQPVDSLAAFFQSYLEYGELRMVVEATPLELDACRRLLPGFADLFHVQVVPSFTREAALTVLEQHAAALERRLALPVEAGVAGRTYHLFKRFAPYEAFPGKATAFLTDITERAHQQHQPALNEEAAVQAFIRRTGLPEMLVRDEVPLQPAAVLEWFSTRVIDQPEACRKAADLVTTFKSGLNDPGRPLGVLLFCGPTGVGKTALAREIANYFFGHGEEAGQRLIRLDMSEFNGPGAATRFLQNPRGQCSEWIAKMRQQPFAVLLLDEVEKAAPEVFDVLLGLCDEGRLSDETGRVTTFRSAIVIMTTNLGAAQRATIGFGDPPPPAFLREVMHAFRPEFFNRLDAVVAFQPLGPATIRAITERELQQMARREGVQKRNLRLAWSDGLIDHLAQAGFDPRYGARPLQRAIETRVVAPLAHYLVTHPMVADTYLWLELEEGQVAIRSAAGREGTR